MPHSQYVLRVARALGQLAAVTAVVSACAISSEPRLVSVPDPDLRPASRLDQIADDRTAAATVASIAERELGFSSFPITFRFYPNTEAFERVLLEVGYDRALASSTANTMVAIGGHRAVLLNDARLLALPWVERVALLAHEVGHTLQYELGGGRRGTSDQWLREGFAEWLSIRVLERLEDSVSLTVIRRARQSELRAVGRSKLPRLSELVTFPQWVGAGKNHRVTMYPMAFLAADFLIECHGIPAVLDYFKRLATSEDRTGNFRAAFGEEIENFEAALIDRVLQR